MRWIGLVLLEWMSNLPLFLWFVLPDCRLILVLVTAWFDYDYASLCVIWLLCAYAHRQCACGTTVLWYYGSVAVWITHSHGWLFGTEWNCWHLLAVLICLLWMDVMMMAWCFAASSTHLFVVDGCDDGMMLCSEWFLSVQQRKEKSFSAAAGDTGVSSPIAAWSCHLVSDWPCSCY